MVQKAPQGRTGTRRTAAGNRLPSRSVVGVEGKERRRPVKSVTRARIESAGEVPSGVQPRC